jgi:iron complex transport system ATP-binding protein
MMEEPALRATDLGFKTRDGQRLVDRVSITIGTGERLAIVGPNGSGKSTLLRMLAGILKPTTGEVLCFGSSLKKMRPIERARRIAVVGQTDQPDPRVTVWDYAGLGRVPHSGSLSRAEEWGIIRDALDRVGLADKRDRALGTLSGGERQRAQIARALAQEPAILFLDEPTNHLDPRARSDLLDLVGGLGVTVVAVLHDLPLVPVFATSVAVLDQGMVAAFGPPNDALAAPIVRGVFAVDLLRMRHPTEDRDLTILDIQPAKGA